MGFISRPAFEPSPPPPLPTKFVRSKAERTAFSGGGEKMLCLVESLQTMHQTDLSFYFRRSRVGRVEAKRYKGRGHSEQKQQRSQRIEIVIHDRRSASPGFDRQFIGRRPGDKQRIKRQGSESEPQIDQHWAAGASDQCKHDAEESPVQVAKPANQRRDLSAMKRNRCRPA